MGCYQEYMIIMRSWLLYRPSEPEAIQLHPTPSRETSIWHALERKCMKELVSRGQKAEAYQLLHVFYLFIVIF